MVWTAEQVLALAPDGASAKAGKGLASAGQWEMTGCDGESVWGLAKGSAASPYQAAVAFSGPAFKCSCPSRKIPCKHVIGLMLMVSEGAVKPGEKPAWVREWVEKREAKAVAAPREKAAAPAKSEDHTKRAEQRESRVSKGVEELSLWLHDVVRNGLAAPELQSSAGWKRIEARMVDSQAPGLARQVKLMEALVGTSDWQERVLERLGSLHLLLRAYSKLDSLPEGMQNDVRAAIGWTWKKEELAKKKVVADNWTVVAQREYEEERLKVRRSWLSGERTGLWAGVLAFSVAGQPFDINLAPGSALRGELVFYPSAYPQRALVISQTPGSIVVPHGRPARELQREYAAALGSNPWLDAQPWLVQGRLASERDQWQVITSDDERVPIRMTGNRGWTALALTGGAGMSLCGEWDGRALHALSIWQGGRFNQL